MGYIRPSRQPHISQQRNFSLKFTVFQSSSENTMVKIAVASASNVGMQVIEALLARKKHQIVVLYRSEIPAGSIQHPDLTYVKVNFQDKKQLTDALRGVHTMLSFIIAHKDPGSVSQKNLIDAAIEAGVKRFAPSEWGCSNPEGIPWYAEKVVIRGYLEELNKEKKVIEYSLFQCGHFADYLAFPHRTAKQLLPLNMHYDFHNCRAIVVEGREHIDSISLITVFDLANVVAEAIEYEGEWPVQGGVLGTTVTPAQILELGEKIRDRPFTVEKVTLEDLETGVVETSWVPLMTHPAIPTDKVLPYSKSALQRTLIGMSKGAFTVGDGWNKLLPSYRFIPLEGFLYTVWAGESRKALSSTD